MSKPDRHKYVRAVTVTMIPGASLTAKRLREAILKGLPLGLGPLGAELVKSIKVRAVDTD